MAVVGKLTKYQATGGGEDFFFYSKPDALNGLVSGYAEVPLASVTNVQQSVKGHSRRQYPGDPSPIQVSVHARTRLKAPRAARQALPGSNFYFEVEVSDGTTVKTEVITITSTAPLPIVHSWALANATADFILRSPDGEPYEIAAAAP